MRGSFNVLSLVVALAAGVASAMKPEHGVSIHDSNSLKNEYDGQLEEARNVTSHNSARVALCLLIKDENPADVIEWIRYYSGDKLGVGKIYVYDHASKVSAGSYLGQFVQAGLVDVKYFNHQPSNPDELGIGEPYDQDTQGVKVQYHVYTECLRNHGQRHKFMGVFDIDEYLELVQQPAGSTKNDSMKEGVGSSEPLADFLEEFSEDGALMIYWRMFSACGHVERPWNGTLNGYTCCTPKHYGPNSLHKTITTMEHWNNGPRVCHVHNCVGTRTIVDEHHVAVGESKVTWDRVILRHYHTKSYEDYYQKNQRAWPGHDSDPQNNPRYSFKGFEELEKAATERCTPL